MLYYAFMPPCHAADATRHADAFISLITLMLLPLAAFRHTILPADAMLSLQHYFDDAIIFAYFSPCQ